MSKGKKIKALREKENLSQEELATLCGWTNTARIKKYESGYNSVCFEDAVSLASILGVTPAFFMEEDEDAIEFIKYKRISVPVVGELDGVMVNLNNFVLTHGGALGNEKRAQTVPYRKFGLKVNSFKMNPEYSDNDILIIDSHAGIIHGANVVVKSGINSYSIKRLKIGENKNIILEDLQLGRCNKKEMNDDVFFLIGPVIAIHKQKPL